jgi:xylulokinase
MVEDRYLLGIDLGTTGVKSVLYRTDGKPVGTSYREYPTISLHSGWAEQDTDRWWTEVVTTVKAALHRAKIAPKKIVGIGCCGQSHGPTPLTKDGSPLAYCITHEDRRAVRQAEWVKERGGTGSQVRTAVKILWWKEKDPSIFHKAYKFLVPKDVIAHRLTGVFSTDPTDAAYTDMFDFDKHVWSDRLLEAYDIPKEKLPEIHQPWEIKGYVIKQTAKETGLREDTPVVTGGADWACTRYGAGLIKPGRAIDMTGTTAGITLALPRLNPNTSFWGKTIVPTIEPASGGSSQEGAGNMLRWFRDELGVVEKSLAEMTGIDTYFLMDREADTIEPGPGSILIIPNFVGGTSLGSKYGVIFGLTVETTRGQIIRAFMEALAYRLRLGLDNARAKGIDVKEVWAIGGGGKSQVWRQIKADVMNVPYCKINVDEGGCFGVAILAGVGVGVYRDLIKPIDSMVKVVERNKPREKYRKKYEELFKVYKKLNAILEESKIFDEYAGIKT